MAAQARRRPAQAAQAATVAIAVEACALLDGRPCYVVTATARPGRPALRAWVGPFDTPAAHVYRRMAERLAAALLAAPRPRRRPRRRPAA